MSTNTETQVRTPATISTPKRRYRVGDAVLMGERAYAVVETSLAGILVETLDRSRTQTFVPAHDMDETLRPAP